MLSRSVLVIVFAIALNNCAGSQKNEDGRSDHPDLRPKLVLPMPKGNSMGDVLELFVHEKAPALSDYQNCDRKYFDFRSKEVKVTQSQINLARELVKKYRDETHWCFFVKLLEIGNPLGFEAFDTANEKKFIESFMYLAPVATAFQIETASVDYLVIAGFQYQSLAMTFTGRSLNVSPSITSTIVNYWKLKRQQLEKDRGLD
jgi:hypothetical protein